MSAAVYLGGCNNDSTIQTFDVGTAMPDAGMILLDSGFAADASDMVPQDTGPRSRDAAPAPDARSNAPDATNPAPDAQTFDDAQTFADAQPFDDAQVFDDASAPDAAAPDALPADTGANACIAGTTPPCSGHHRAGQDCGGCHDSIFQFQWTAAGTLYTPGGSALAGATIEIVDANNQVVDIVTCSNGNFYTTTPLAFPLRVRASQCPNDTPMIMSVMQGQGSCGGCHGVSTASMHLP